MILKVDMLQRGGDSTYLAVQPGHRPRHISSGSGIQRPALGFGQGSGKLQCTGHLHCINPLPRHDLMHAVEACMRPLTRLAFDPSSNVSVM